MKKCLYCHRAYTARRSDQKFCTPDCRKRWNKYIERATKMILERTEDTMIVVNPDGVRKKIAFASDRQMEYLNNLRVKLGRKPLAGKIAVWKATKQINTCLEKIAENEKTAD